MRLSYALLFLILFTGCKNHKKSHSKPILTEIHKIVPRAPTLNDYIKSGDWNGAQELMQQGCDLSERDEWGNTPLLLALKHHYSDIAIMLIDAGAEIDEINNQGETLLDMIMSEEDVKVLKKLIDLKYPFENDILFRSWSNGHIVLSDLLASEGYDLPFMSSVMMGEYNFAMYLAGKKADINVINDLGETALIYSVKNSQYDFTRFLITAGANLEIPNKNGETPLLVAARMFDMEATKILLEAGASAKVSNRDGDNFKKIWKRQIKATRDKDTKKRAKKILRLAS